MANGVQMKSGLMMSSDDFSAGRNNLIELELKIKNKIRLPMFVDFVLARALMSLLPKRQQQVRSGRHCLHCLHSHGHSAVIH